LNQLSDLDFAVRTVAAYPDRKGRLGAINKILEGRCDIGTRSKPNPNGIALLHRRALFMTRLSTEKIWTG
jgi:hypothetical protein